MPPTDATQPPYTIRAATAADNGLLSEFGAAMFTEAFGPDNTPENLAVYLADTYNPARQAQELADPDSQYFIAEAGGKPAGYARLARVPAPEQVLGRQPIELVRFYVSKAWHGQGLAGELLRVCLRAAEQAGCDVMWLSTWQRNARGIAFYRKWGFEIAGTLVFQIGDDPQTDWLMTRAVPYDYA